MLLGQLAVLHLLSLVLAALVLLLHPLAPPLHRIQEPGAISVTEMPALPDPLWIDARTNPVEPAPVADAILCNEDDWDAGLNRVLEHWHPERAIVVACDGAGCEASQQVAARLRQELGIATVFHLLGGWPALEQAQ